MTQLSIAILDEGGKELARSEAPDRVNLVYPADYRPGDRIALRGGGPHLVIQLDDAMEPCFVYLKGGDFTFAVPFDQEREAYSPRAFAGKLHLLKARRATPAEIRVHKNLALNVYDRRENVSCYPHASANAETRNQSAFAVRNVIDGNTENHSHGSWPFESWGIDRRADAELTVDFGRPVEIDRVVLCIRADFPHDSWWRQAELEFSDGSSQTVPLLKTDRPQSFPIQKRTVRWVKLKNLLRDESDPSPFPALTQIEIYGAESPDIGPDEEEI